MRVAVSSSHVVPAAPSSSEGGFLTLFPCSSMGSLPQETVLHKMLQCGPFPRMQSLRNCCSVGPLWGHKSCLKTCSSVSSSLHGSTGPGRSLLQHRLFTVSQPPSGIHQLQRGVLHRLQVDICSTVDLHGLQRHSLPHHGLQHRLQGNLCSVAWSTSSPSFFTDLCVCRVISLAYSYSSLQMQSVLCSNFSPFLNTLSQRRYHRRCCT